MLLLPRFGGFLASSGVLISGRMWVIGKHWYSSQAAGGAFPEVLLALVESQFLSAVNTHIFAGADFLSCTVGLLFGQT